MNYCLIYLRKQIFLFIAMMSLAMPTISFGQSISWLPTDNLLQDNDVHGIIQDKYGYIWIATTSGLVCYDGYSINVIKPGNQGDRLFMQDSRVLAIKNWTDRFIWVQLRGHFFCCYDVDQDKFVDYTGNGTFNQTYKEFSLLGEDMMLFDNQKGGKLIHYDGKTFTSRYINLPSSNVVDIIKTDKSKYLITEDGKLYNYNKGKFHLEYSAYITNKIRKISTARYFNGKIYLATDDGIYEYDLKSHIISRSQYNPSSARIVKNNKDNLIIYSSNGSDIFYLTFSKMYHIQNIYTEKLVKLNATPTYRFLTAHDGTLWISSYGNGIMSYDTNTEKLKSYSELLSTTYTTHIYEDRDGDIWVSQENLGVSIISFRKENARHIYYKDNDAIDRFNYVRLLRYIDNNIYIGNTQKCLTVTDEDFNNGHDINKYKDDITAMAKDSIGRLWVGTKDNGIYVDDQNYQYTSNPQSLDKGKISDIITDHKGRVWISLSERGIDLVDGNKFIHFFTNQQTMYEPRSMSIDNRGNIWVCTSQGALFFNPDQLIHNSRAYHIVNVSKANIRMNEVHAIYIDKKERIWIGSIGNGIMMINKKDTTVYTTSNGLASDNVQSIIEDKNGNIWIGTDNGLSKWNGIVAPQKGDIGKYNKEVNFTNSYFSTNLLGNNYSENAAICLYDGLLAFGTHHGVVVFDPQKVRQEKSLFNLAITNIAINGVSIHDINSDFSLDSALIKTHKISLKYNQNSLTFYFSDFNFSTQHKKSKFTYYLEGYDKSWSNMSYINSVQYKNLPSGNYILHARACNANGVWTPGEVSLNITIRPPFWATWWAYIIYTLLITSIIWYLYRNFVRINNLRNKIKVENELTEYKIQFFTNISHEFRTPLTIIRGEMDRLKTIDNIPSEMKPSLSSMHKSINRMTRLINQLLEFRKMQNKKLHLALEKTDVISYIHNIFHNFKGMAENKNINFQFLPFDKSYEMYVDINYLDKIIYNLISNAIKYTPSNGDITLLVALSQEKNLIISVEDTGIGIDEDRQASLFQKFNQSNHLHDSMGIGLYLASELVKTHHGKISYQRNSPQGSIFQVELPTDESIYQSDDFITGTNDVLLKVEENNKADDDENGEDSLLLEYQEQKLDPMNSQRILVVEDDNDIREFLKRELQKYFNIDIATDGQEAWEKIKESKPDMLISDVLMPQLNGYDLTKKIRADETLNDIPIILLTALTAEKKQIAGINAGADAYIEKPFSIILLVAKCCQLMEQRKNLKIAYGQKTEGTAKAILPGIIKDEQDREFQEELDKWVKEHLTDSQFNIDLFAENMGYGRNTFYKKIKKITGTTPNEYIQTLRMNKAVELLRDERYTIAEIAYQIGLKDPYYFSKLFKSFYGISPSKYRAGNQSPERL